MLKEGKNLSYHVRKERKIAGICLGPLIEFDGIISEKDKVSVVF